MCDLIAAHARETLPEECCGLLIGRGCRVERLHRARNVDPSPTKRFLIDPADHFAAIRLARAAGQEIVGVYHSHPSSPPIPSDTDRREITYTDYLYVIVRPGPHAPELRAFRLEGAEFVEVELDVRSF